MASSYSPLKIELIGTGEQAGTWGTTTNTNLGTALEEAITGRATATFSSDANFTLPYIDSNAAQVFRNLVLNVTSSGNLSATRDLIIPAIEKQYIVENNTSGGQSIRVKTAAGNGVTISAGRVANVFCDGTNTRFADDFVDINGGAIDGTPIGAASASTGVFTTATITTATVTTGNITTGNITTGNINTLTVGTQTNKATVSYTTNTARTLTIPNVGGNRTFAFIDEAQTFSATQTFNTLLFGTQTNKATLSYTTDAARTLTVPAVGGNRTFAFLEEAQTFTAAQTFNATQTVAANLVLSGNARRIQGPFTNYDNNSVIIQNSASNTTTGVQIAPNGTATASALHLSSTSDLTDSVVAALFVDPTNVALFSIANGAKSFQNLSLVNGGIARIIIDPTGQVAIGGPVVSGYRLSVDGPFISNNSVLFPAVYSVTVGGSFRTVYIDVNGQLGGLSSTRESKADISNIEDTNWLMNLEPVSFKRRKKDYAGAYTAETYDNTEYGLIADDVVNVRPEICVMDKGKLSGINYEQLIAPMLKEIQNLRAEIEALKAKG
jgi:hypothetical protein